MSMKKIKFLIFGPMKKIGFQDFWPNQRASQLFRIPGIYGSLPYPKLGVRVFVNKTNKLRIIAKMLTIIRRFRACRLSEITEKCPNIYRTHQQRGMKILSRRSSFEVMSKRLFSTIADPYQDPLSDCEAIYPLNDVQLEELTGNDPQEIKKVRLLQMELAVKTVRQPSTMPKRISLEQWRNLLTLSRTGKDRYLMAVKKKETRKEPTNPVMELSEDDTVIARDSIFDHKVFRNALYPMLHPSDMHRTLNSNLLEALLFGPPLILDCGFESVMTVREVKNVCQQLGHCFNSNRFSRKPYNMVFCNLKRDSLMGESLWASSPNIYDEDVPIIMSESCYTEMYPKERLVYLTPHCRETVQYNPNDIYIIGAIVDKSNPGPHTLIKAKAQGIRMGSFPIDKYIVWKQGSKSLTLNQVVEILLKMALTKNWVESFKQIPKRKIIDLTHSFGYNKTEPPVMKY